MLGVRVALYAFQRLGEQLSHYLSHAEVCALCQGFERLVLGGLDRDPEGSVLGWF